MYVLFPVLGARRDLDLRNRYADKGGFAAVVVRVKLPDGTDYKPVGKLDYIDPVGRGLHGHGQSARGDAQPAAGRAPNPAIPATATSPTASSSP